MNPAPSIATNSLKEYAAQTSPANREKLRTKIRELVGQVFFGTVLKQAQSEMNPDNPFNGGPMAQAFRGQLNQELIDRWSKTANFAVADRLAREWTQGTQATQNVRSSNP